MQSKSEMNTLASELGEWWNCRSYGANMEDSVSKTKDLATLMKSSGFIFHVKPGGDGYGHSLHNAFACGKPVITRSSHYRGKLGEQLFTHGVTCIDLDQCSMNEAVEMLRTWAQPNIYPIISNQVYTRFKQLVDFDKEEQQIRQFLTNLR